MLNNCTALQPFDMAALSNGPGITNHIAISELVNAYGKIGGAKFHAACHLARSLKHYNCEIKYICSPTYKIHLLPLNFFNLWVIFSNFVFTDAQPLTIAPLLTSDLWPV